MVIENLFSTDTIIFSFVIYKNVSRGDWDYKKLNKFRLK